MDRQRFEALDGMRGVAALIVVLFHSAMVLGIRDVVPAGALSVDLFFVISGFVIALSYEDRLRSGLGFKKFLIARARRLLPVHMCAMVLLTAVFAGLILWPDPGIRGKIPISTLAIEAAFNTAFIPDPLSPVAGAFSSLRSPFPINPPEWSLWDEWIVSILFGAVLFAVRTKVMAAASFVSGAIVLWAASRVPQGWDIGEHLADFLLGPFRALAGFAVGAILFRLYARGALDGLPIVRPPIVYLAWALLCTVPLTWHPVAFECALAIFVAPFAVALLVRGERKVAKMHVWLGALSYPLYASHVAGLMLVSGVADHLRITPASWQIPAMAFGLMMSFAAAQLVKIASELRLPFGARRLDRPGQPA